MSTETPRMISLRWRIGLWVAAWIIAAIATVGIGLGFLLYAWMFPSGLLNECMPKDWDPPISDTVFLILGWAIYVGLTICGLMQKRRVRYFIVFGILCVLLAVNVAGCHVALKQPINIDD
ncbi:MAG TPA: hypothetical protein VNU95_06045 [Candidatus Acidoferrales bacterium]|jgi:hypothetical protein|nr:hypothetical protein [Candidatus Acidoferrales bacterium]